MKIKEAITIGALGLSVLTGGCRLVSPTDIVTPPNTTIDEGPYEINITVTDYNIKSSKFGNVDLGTYIFTENRKEIHRDFIGQNTTAGGKIDMFFNSR